jgi:hypothetical protein
MLPQRTRDYRGQRNCSTGPHGLRFDQMPARPNALERLPHDQTFELEIDILPPESEQLTLS